MAENTIKINPAITDYLNNIGATYKLGRVFLFGSTAHGTAEWDSDIDLAIFSADVTEDNEIEIMTDLLIKAMPYKLDIQPLVFLLEDYYSDNDFIQKEIIERGVEIYPVS